MTLENENKKPKNNRGWNLTDEIRSRGGKKSSKNMVRDENGRFLKKKDDDDNSSNE